MLAASAPALLPQPFAASAIGGTIRTIPNTTVDSTAASLALGFPIATFTPIPLGGTPPNGEDFNGILNWLSSINQWIQAGGQAFYNAAFSTSIGGYPNGALLMAAAMTNLWQSTVDNNTSDPDTGGANWTNVPTLSGGIPSGTIVSMGPTLPSGWMQVLNSAAAAVSRTGAYAGIFGMWGTTFGAGDGSTTFVLPWVPAGYVPVQGTPGVLTHGRVKDHTHNYGVSTFTGGQYLTGSSPTAGVPISTPNAPEGGPDNLAAGLGGLVCVKY